MRQRFARAVTGTSDLWLSFLSAVPVVGALLRACGLTSAVDAPEPVATSDGEQFRPEDVALSLLRMVSYNIGQIAYLNARVHGLDRIYFGGNFIRDHPYTIADISYSVDFWSAGKMKALFLRHDGYLGAIGAFIGASSAMPSKIIDEHVAEKKQQDNADKTEKENDEGVTNGRRTPSNGKDDESGPDCNNGQSDGAHLTERSSSVGDGVNGDMVDTASDSIKSEVIDPEDMHLGANGRMAVLKDVSGKDPMNGSTISSSKDSVSETPEDVVDEAYDKKLTNTSINSNNSPSSKKRKRASKRNKASAAAAEQQKKLAGPQVAVAKGKTVPPTDLDDGEWTTVRIRSKGGCHQEQNFVTRFCLFSWPRKGSFFT